MDTVKQLGILGTALLLTACASQKVWYKQGVSEQVFRQDNAQCVMTAESNTPVYIPKNTGSSTTHHSGSIRNTDGQSVSYSGTSTTYDTSVDLSGVAIAAKRERIYNNCMIANGYRLVDKVSDSSVDDADIIKDCRLPNGNVFNTSPSRCREAGGSVRY